MGSSFVLSPSADLFIQSAVSFFVSFRRRSGNPYTKSAFDSSVAVITTTSCLVVEVILLLLSYFHAFEGATSIYTILRMKQLISCAVCASHLVIVGEFQVSFVDHVAVGFSVVTRDSRILR